MDDLVNYKDIADAIGYWYVIGSEIREQYGVEGRKWAINEGGINSKNMCDQFIKAMDFTLNNFTPVKTFDIFTENGYDIKNLPNGKLGFDLHVVNLEAIKKTVS